MARPPRERVVLAILSDGQRPQTSSDYYALVPNRPRKHSLSRRPRGVSCSGSGCSHSSFHGGCNDNLHEGWRYPETVRWAARRGAHIVFHPQFHPAETSDYRPTTYGDPRNTFHEKAVLCRAAENTCYFATVNYAEAGSPTTSAVARPDGSLLCYQPCGESGLLLAEVDAEEATALLAKRHKPTD